MPRCYKIKTRERKKKKDEKYQKISTTTIWIYFYFLLTRLCTFFWTAAAGRVVADRTPKQSNVLFELMKRRHGSLCSYCLPVVFGSSWHPPIGHVRNICLHILLLIDRLGFPPLYSIYIHIGFGIDWTGYNKCNTSSSTMSFYSAIEKNISWKLGRNCRQRLSLLCQCLLLDGILYENTWNVICAHISSDSVTDLHTAVQPVRPSVRPCVCVYRCIEGAVGSCSLLSTGVLLPPAPAS